MRQDGERRRRGKKAKAPMVVRIEGKRAKVCKGGKGVKVTRVAKAARRQW